METCWVHNPGVRGLEPRSDTIVKVTNYSILAVLSLMTTLVETYKSKDITSLLRRQWRHNRTMVSNTASAGVASPRYTLTSTRRIKLELCRIVHSISLQKTIFYCRCSSIFVAVAIQVFHWLTSSLPRGFPIACQKCTASTLPKINN